MIIFIGRIISQWRKGGPIRTVWLIFLIGGWTGEDGLGCMQERRGVSDG